MISAGLENKSISKIRRTIMTISLHLFLNNIASLY